MTALDATAEAQVAGSSFYAGMRALPRDERHAMYAVYGFCRAVDDIADDGHHDRATRRAALAEWRHDVANLYAGGDPGKARFLAPHVARFGLAHADFDAVFDGMAMDIAEDIRCPSSADLDLYCDRVAVAVGRLSVRIFGMDDGPGAALAHHLGRALQLTNILRDIDEDAAIGRVYLPREPIAASGIARDDIAALIGDPRLDAVCRQLGERAQAHFAEAQAIMTARPRGHLIAPRLMAGAYAELLRRMLRQGWQPPRHRVRHNRLALAWMMIRLRLAR